MDKHELLSSLVFCSKYTCKEYALLGHHEDTFAHIYTVAICNEALISALSVLEHTDNCFDCSIGDGRMPAYVSEQIKDWLGKVVICPNIPNSNKFEMAYSANVSVDYTDILQIGVQQMISKRSSISKWFFTFVSRR